MKSRWTMICCAFIYSCMVLCTSALAADKVDQLYLCGVVKEINAKEGKVRVKVTSEGCTGEKTFKVLRVQQLSKFVEGKTTCFMIDTSTCPQHQVATILAE